MNQTRVGDLVPIIARNEPRFAEAYRAMVRGGPYPEPENAIKQACLEIRHPMRQLCIVQLAAIRAQRPVEQVLAPTRANEDWVRSFYPDDTATIAECVLAENQPDMLLDEAQQLVYRDESPAKVALREMPVRSRLRNPTPILRPPMATALNRPVRRSIEIRERGRAAPQLYTVELSQDGVRMRGYGTRTWLGPVPFGVLLLNCGRVTAQLRARDRARSRRPA